MRKGTFVISILVFGVLLLNGRAIAAERPVVYGKHQWEWVAPTGVNKLREWGGYLRGQARLHRSADR